MFTMTSTRTRVPTEERELLPMANHRRSPSLTGSVLTNDRQDSPVLQQRPRALSPPRRATTTIHIPPPHPRRRDTISVHDAALAELNVRFIGPGKPSLFNTSTHTIPTTTFPPQLDEPVYDPYSGTLVGTFKGVNGGEGVGADNTGTNPAHGHVDVNLKSSNASSVGSDGSISKATPPSMTTTTPPADSAPYSNTWAAMAKIRTLQSEVAKTHMQSMANDQERSARASRRGSVGSSRERGGGRASSRDGGGGSDKSSVDVFAGRREAIDEIVKKLEDLSCAVKHLHALPSPSFPFKDKSPLASPSTDDRDSIHKRIRTNTVPDQIIYGSAPSVTSPASSTSTFRTSPFAPMSTSTLPHRYGPTHPYSPTSPSTGPATAKSPRQHTQSLRAAGSSQTQANNYIYPPRQSTQTSATALSRSSSGRSKATLPSIMDSATEGAKSPKRSSFRTKTTHDGWPGLGLGPMHGSPRSTQASLT